MPGILKFEPPEPISINEQRFNDLLDQLRDQMLDACAVKTKEQLGAESRDSMIRHHHEIQDFCRVKK